MALDDFDIDGLAAYLHLSPQQVERLANRGQLPGRKVAGQWRFSRPEIHHWMEERMGVLEDDELADLEGVLAKDDVNVTGPITVAARLQPQAIAIPLEARTKNSVIEAMTQLAARTGLLWDPEAMAEAVRGREQLHSTATDMGVALLHPRRPLPTILAEPLLALGVTTQGIPFGGSRRLTDVFFLICSTDDRGHLRMLARLSRLISADDLLDQLRAVPDAQAAYRLLCEAEENLSS